MGLRFYTRDVPTRMPKGDTHMSRDAFLLAVVVGLLLSGCGPSAPAPAPSPTPPPTETATPPPTETPTPSPTSTRPPTKTPTLTVEPKAATQTMEARLRVAREECSGTDVYSIFYYGDELEGRCVRVTHHIMSSATDTILVGAADIVPINTRGMRKSGSLRDRDAITVYGIVEYSNYTISGVGALQGRNATLGNRLMGVRAYLILGPRGVVYTSPDIPW